MFSFTQDVVVEEWNIFKYCWRRNISLQTLKQKGPSCRSAVHHTISCFTANMDPLWSLFHVCVIGHNPFLAEEGGGWVPHGRCETHAWGHTFEKWTTGWPWPRSSKLYNLMKTYTFSLHTYLLKHFICQSHNYSLNAFRKSHVTILCSHNVI